MDDEELVSLEGQLARMAAKASDFSPREYAMVASRLNRILQTLKGERTENGRRATELDTRETAVRKLKSLQEGVAEIGKNTTEVKEGIAKIGENTTVKDIDEKVTKIGEAVNDNTFKGIDEKITKIGDAVNDTHKKVTNLGDDNVFKDIKEDIAKIGENATFKGIKEDIAKIGDNKTFKDISKGVSETQGMGKTIGAMSEAIGKMSSLTLEGIANKVKEGLPAPTDLGSLQSDVQALTETVNSKLTARPDATRRLQEQIDSLSTEVRELKQYNNVLTQQNEILSSEELLVKLIEAAGERERVALESKRKWKAQALRSDQDLKKVDGERQQYSSEVDRLDQRLKEAQHQLADVPTLKAQLKTATTELRNAQSGHDSLVAQLNADLLAAQHRPTQEEMRLETELAAARHRPTPEEKELSVKLERANNDLRHATDKHSTDMEQLKTELNTARNDLKKVRANSSTEMGKLKTELETAKDGLH